MNILNKNELQNVGLSAPNCWLFFKFILEAFLKILVPVAQTKVPKAVALLTDAFTLNPKYLVRVTPDLTFPNIRNLMKHFFAVLNLNQMLFHWKSLLSRE